MSTHYAVQCIHGTIVSQCRCPSPSKHVTIVDCPDSCPQSNAGTPHGRAQALRWLEQESEAYAQGQKYAQGSGNRDMIAGYVRDGMNDELFGFPLNYLKRASMFGLDTPQGRQALGKAAATLIDYMAHAIEIHGPMPKPGFSSGEIQEWDDA